MVRLRCPPFQWVTRTPVVRYLGFGNLLSGVAGVVIGRLEGFIIDTIHWFRNGLTLVYYLLPLNILVFI
ncbi:hypothetical protein Hanom_Chr11g01024421 [Helianthus anomalus]